MYSRAKFSSQFACRVELHLSGSIGTAGHPNMQKFRTIAIFF